MNTRQLSSCVKDMFCYAKLTDYVFHEILHSSEIELKEVSAIVA